MEEHTDRPNTLAKDSSTREATRTWGFRKSTIARREFMEEIGILDLSSLTPRRSARQAKSRAAVGRGRGKKACDTPATPTLKRGRGGRKGALVDTSRVSSHSADERVTPELGGDDADVSENKMQAGSHSQTPPMSTAAPTAVSDGVSGGAPASDHGEDSDELTLRELQERARKRRSQVSAGAAARTDTETAVKEVEPDLKKPFQQEETLVGRGPMDMQGLQAASRSDQRTRRGSRTDLQAEQEEKQDNEANQLLGDNDCEEDPNSLYCICRQKHNNRFMICCDRCQEWFHGDCVGITSARGRLLEENGEDYICPSCSPCQSPADGMKQPAFPRTSVSPESLLSGFAAEDGVSQDEGIKGKIRKTTGHSTKRKIKIFQSVEVQATVSENRKAEPACQESGPGSQEAGLVLQKAGLTSQEVAPESQEAGQVAESSASPRCIGPGCVNDALPESVYCGHQCIIRHAALAMQTLSEPRMQPEIHATKPATPKPPLKIQKSFLEKLFRRKPTERPAEEEHAGRQEELVQKEKPIAASLSSDPRRQATGAELSSAITSAVFYKSSMYHSGVTVCVDADHHSPAALSHFRLMLTPTQQGCRVM